MIMWPIPPMPVPAADAVAALPDGAVILGADGRAWQRDDSHDLADQCGPWTTSGLCDSFTHDEIPLPALLLWNPDWTRL